MNKIKEAVIAGDSRLVDQLTAKALNRGVEAARIIEDGYIQAMDVVGERFGAGEIYIPEMLIAARAVKRGLEMLKPHLLNDKVITLAKVLLCTVEGDRHDIGKNLVGMMLEGSGMKVVDLGVDLSPDQIVEAVKIHQPQFLGLSALLTTSMNSMEATIKTLVETGVRDKVKVFVGGAPVTQQFSDQIGSDGYCPDAGAAVARFKELLS